MRIVIGVALDGNGIAGACRDHCPHIAQVVAELIVIDVWRSVPVVDADTLCAVDGLLYILNSKFQRTFASLKLALLVRFVIRKIYYQTYFSDSSNASLNRYTPFL
jgi:hypothetical protein